MRPARQRAAPGRTREKNPTVKNPTGGCFVTTLMLELAEKQHGALPPRADRMLPGPHHDDPRLPGEEPDQRLFWERGTHVPGGVGPRTLNAHAEHGQRAPEAFKGR